MNEIILNHLNYRREGFNRFLSITKVILTEQYFIKRDDQLCLLKDMMKKDPKMVFDSTTIYFKGKMEGFQLSFYGVGMRANEGCLRNSKRIGHWIHWHQTGAKESEGAYDNWGRKDGPWTYWHFTGKKALEGSYIHGRTDGSFSSWSLS